MSNAGNAKDRLVSERKNNRDFRKLVAPLSCLMVVLVAVVFMMPAISMTHGALVCGLEEHAHSKACYEQVLVCGQEESEGADPETGEGGHAHAEACYEKQLVCDKPEHKHSEACYAPVQEDAEDSQNGNFDAGGQNGSSVANDNGAVSDGDIATDGMEASNAGQSEETGVEGENGEADNQSVNADSAENGEGGAAASDDGTQTFKGELKNAKGDVILGIDVAAPAGALPEGAAMRVQSVGADKAMKDVVPESIADTAVSEKTVGETIDEAVVAKTDGKIAEKHAIDIAFVGPDGVEVEPTAPVTVTFESDQIAKTATAAKKAQNPENAKALVVHVDDRGEANVVDTLTKEDLAARDQKAKKDEVVFDSDRFSVYAIVYTVDFHWEVDGQTFDLTTRGGDATSLKSLLEALRIASDDEKTEFDELASFVEGVASVEFSNSELMATAKVEHETTVGDLKAELGLQPEYAANLSEDDIAQIDAKRLDAGDWALLSLKPFDTEETLTITMQDGQAFTVKVTDDQIKQTVISASGDTYEITVSYGPEAGIPDGAELKVREIAEGDEGYDQLKQDVASGLGGDAAGIPSKPSLFDISIWSDGREVEPAEGSKVDVKITLMKSAAQGEYTADDAALLVNDAPVSGEVGSVKKAVRVVHQVQPGQVEAVKTDDTISDESATSEFSTDSFSNWLVYLDEDLEEITIGYGDTITLRPYSEWVWMHDAEDEYKNVTWNYPKTNGRANVTQNNYTDEQLGEMYTAYTLTANYNPGEFYIERSNGKRIKVIVGSQPQSDLPATVGKTAGIKVNLFNYNKDKSLDVNGNVASSWDWQQRQYGSGYFDNNGIRYNNPPYEKSVNTYSDLKFLGWGANNGNSAINKYDAVTPTQGIVKSSLADQDQSKNGYPQLQNGQSLNYLFGGRSVSEDDVKAYTDVEGLFQQDTDGYYYFNSNSNYAWFDESANKFVLYEHTYSQKTDKGITSKPIGFFPFHEYDSNNHLSPNHDTALDHHFGLSMDVDFELPESRQNNGKDIIFEFSGDDDMWVFVDDQLVLDLGGIHQPITGKIDFTHGKVYAYNKQDANFNIAPGEHTLKVFYLERGGCDSNCSIKFNLPTYKTLDLSKQLKGLTAAEWDKYKDEEFTYELMLNGNPYNSPAGAENKQALQAQRIGADGQVKECFIVHNGQITLKHGETVRIPHLSGTDTFYVAEEKSLNMDQFEAPHAERYYYQVSDGLEHEDEIALTESHTEAPGVNLSDWNTPPYSVNETEKVTFTNTLKEKDLLVEKKWVGQGDHPDEVSFTVKVYLQNDDHTREPYTVAELKDSQNDKVFKLKESDGWKTAIAHLPVLAPDGRIVIYDVQEASVSGYVSSVKDVTADVTLCNVDAMKLWPDDQPRTEVINVRLKRGDGKYYAGEDVYGNGKFNQNGVVYQLKPGNNYTQRFSHVPKDDEYALEEVGDQDPNTTGLVTYKRTIVGFEMTNEPTGGQVDPPAPQDNPEIHKRIDALRDGVKNPDSSHDGEDLTDLYRLYLDYKINSLQEPNGVDLLFVIDHSGSMNNSDWQGNPYRARSVMEALNGEDGVISEFVQMNENNQWAAVGFSGPDGTLYRAVTLFPPAIVETDYRSPNAGRSDSEDLAGWNRNAGNILLPNQGANMLTNYTAGFWRAEQYLFDNSIKNDGKKKVVVFISDGIPTLHIPGLGSDQSLARAADVEGSQYYPDADGGCPNQAKTEFGYFVNDMKKQGYTFGENAEFYTIGFGGTMQTESGAKLLNEMLGIAYNNNAPEGHFMTITDVPYDRYSWRDQYTSVAANQLVQDLRIIMGMSEKFSNIVIQDTLSQYVDLAGSGTDALAAAKAKLTMTDPNDPTKTITLYENGAITNAGQNVLQSVAYDAGSKKVIAQFKNDYEAVPGITYTLSFDVKANQTAYQEYATNGYGSVKGDEDTDFLGTDPANATSVGKPGFHSNNEAKATYDHNGESEEKTYKHPVVQVSPQLVIVKESQDSKPKPLAGAKFTLYKDGYSSSATAEQNAQYKIKDLESKVPSGGTEAVLFDGKLAVGTYWLVETKAPAGYNALPAPIRIVVSESAETSQPSIAAYMSDTSFGDKLVFDKTAGSWKLHVQNSAGKPLPLTGGPGTMPLAASGIVLMAGALAFLARRRVCR